MPEKFHTEGPQTLGTNIKNSVTWATWCLICEPPISVAINYLW